MNLKEELKNVEFELKRAVGGGVDRWLFLAAKQLGSEAAKRNCHCEAKSFKGIVKIFENPLSQSHSNKREFVKLFSLTKRNFIFSRPNGERLEFVSELERTYKFKRGVQRLKNTDRATECAMTNVGENLLKTTVGRAYQPNNEIFVLLSALAEGCNRTSSIPMSEIWMNCIPSPKFLSSL